MREFWFIRHGQSLTNIGIPSKSDEATPLTQLGVTQSELVAWSIDTPPDLFVVSPYLRTSLTAAPTLAKFPGVPVETWQIQEFSYLSYTQYSGASASDRRRLSVKYFLMGDPNLVLGEGGESFNQFINRVESCYKKLVESNKKRIVLFGHGWFMRAGLWVLLRDSHSSQFIAKLENIRRIMAPSSVLLKIYSTLRNKSSMKSFLVFSAGLEAPNCAILKYQIDEPTNAIRLNELEVSHLPKIYRQVSLRNR